MKPAIQAESLSKLYHLGATQKSRHRTLRDALGNVVSAPWRRVRQFSSPGANGNGVRSSVTGASEEGILWALKDFSFQVRPGEMVGVIGQNGSGKSTLLRILSGITEPTSGRVTIHGRVGSLLEIGTGIHPDLSGRENIYLSGAISGLTRREITRKFDDIVAFAELAQFIDTPVKHYSTGMHMRLGFAVASHLDPHIMLVDEALSVGDVAFQAKCYEHLKRLHRSGMSIVFISHSMQEIEDLCDYAIWLDKGMARARGRCMDVIHDYLRAVGQGEPEMPSDPQCMIGDEASAQLKAELKNEIKAELKEEMQAEIRDEILGEIDEKLAREILTPALEEPSHQTKRWGSREVELLVVRFLDCHGQEKRCFRPGSAMTIEFTYYAHVTATEPVFGVEFFNVDTSLTGTALPVIGGNNSLLANQMIPSLEPGPGVVRCKIPFLPFSEGTYLVSLAVAPKVGGDAFDHHEKMYELTIQKDPSINTWGLTYLPTEWQYHPGPRPADVSGAPGADGGPRPPDANSLPDSLLLEQIKVRQEDRGSDRIAPGAS